MNEDPANNLSTFLGKDFFILLLYSLRYLNISAGHCFLASKFRIMIKPIKKKCSMKNSSAMNVVYYSCLGVAVIISAYGYYEGYFVLGNRMSSLSLF